MRPTTALPLGRRALTAVLVLASLLASVAVTVAVAPSASAADAKDFDPGYLIDDALFFDGNAMTSSQIDSFIAAKNPGCAAGRTCIENYRENIKAKSATSYYGCKAISAASNRTAGQIISAVAKACGISPKAILVILQKEQSLITSTAPSNRAFAYAMGAGCPDTAPCDVDYAGFYEQVYYGAKLLKSYTLPTSSHYTRYQAGKTSSIKLNPKSSCGTKSVKVRNQATHALYVYTPYTPNAAAMKNLYGTGDSCSSYGNRNFWRMYTDWFGKTGELGRLAIEDYYQSQGAASGWMGAEIGTLRTSDAYGGGMYREFEGGVVAWSEAKSVVAPITGALLDYWKYRNGPDGVLGWPLQSPDKDDPDGGRFQEFSNAVVASHPDYETSRIYGKYLAAFENVGGFAGSFGWPVANVGADTAPGVYSQEFEGGTIYWDGKRSAYLVRHFDEYLDALGGVNDRYGYPTSGLVVESASGGGEYQRLEGATLIRQDGEGILHAYGKFSDVWFSAKGAKGKLGWPTTSAYTDPISKYRAQDFEGGTVYVGSLGRGYVATEFADAIVRAGGVTGKYGFPTGAWRQNSAGAGQELSKASLVITPEHGVKSIYNGQRDAWWALGAEKGALGWPISQAYATGPKGMYAQDFQKATLYRKGSKYGYVGIRFVPWLESAGGVTGNYGWPSGGVVKSSAAGGGEAQRFSSKRWIVWSNAGDVRSVYGPMDSAWTKFKRWGGPLGWPTGNQTVDSAPGVRYQDFVGGRIYTASGREEYVDARLVSAYVAAGATTGTWGWPKGAPSTSGGVTKQKFALGTATVDAGGGVTFSKGS